jgi:hypothetical protein
LSGVTRRQENDHCSVDIVAFQIALWEAPCTLMFSAATGFAPGTGAGTSV